MGCWTPKEIIEGIECEKCLKEWSFGNPPTNTPNNLYLYRDLSACTRCFCERHMTYFTKEGAMKEYGEKWDFVGYGAKLMSEILNDNPPSLTT